MCWHSDAIFVDVDSSRVALKAGICPCITRSRGSSGGYFVPCVGRRMGAKTMALFQGIDLGNLDVSMLSRRQLGAMVGNAWSVNVSSAVIRELVLAMGWVIDIDMPRR